MDIPVDSIRALVEMMVENDLSRVELREGEALILLRRGQPVIASSGSAPTVMAAPIVGHIPTGTAPAPSVGSTTAVLGPPPAAAAAAESTETFIRSQLVGTFYASPDPESPPFIGVGDNVRPDSVVCLVEAMKVFNEIKAECSGRITRVLVKNGQAVEYDQPLFAIAPA
ncbi:MAG: acetyl-CoA carboxylase biotin carboxyl carrier protein [Planctomycetia bacterium]|nr:MAG: acetyl-CoA carboxylase biotin carboxyl carrier protein [Planctomycetia bacterium]